MSRIDVLSTREVPLGGLRAMTVRRTLPQRSRSFVGAWCFADHYGPDDVAATGGMDVAPHPHTGLQTVSWLFAGQIEHRDSAGNVATVRPGEMNLMTGGSGICHSEVSTLDTSILHGVQLWVVLPEEHRHADRAFQHHEPSPVQVDGAIVRVFLGSLVGATSPVQTFTPLLGAEIVLDPQATLDLDVDPEFEHGVLVDTSVARVGGWAVERGEMGYQGHGSSTLTVHNPTDQPARLIVLGGPPFTEEIVMWWNFVGRTHHEIVQMREQWQDASDRFGTVEGYLGETDRIPAPTMPNAILSPRSNPPVGTAEA
ncbi:pirin family protein [Aeromicrobium sp. CF3.5]|uniref:pirin family protein n=1 Tax=Aeromicrobium sp. CF3.5 TaxID=3373078 RepID=UPI003EE713E2